MKPTNMWFKPWQQWKNYRLEKHCSKLVIILKVSKFQNEFMKSSYLPKYKTKIVRISALYCGTVQGRNPYNICPYFGRNNNFISSFWNLLAFTGNFVKQHEESIDFPVNESQFRAIKLGLENKIALIQGPPGMYLWLFLITKRNSTPFAFHYNQQILSTSTIPGTISPLVQQVRLQIEIVFSAQSKWILIIKLFTCTNGQMYGLPKW